jgi:peptidoglycan/LPS O-acetylase OafA/YrhL
VARQLSLQQAGDLVYFGFASAMTLVVTVAMAAVLHRLVEQPFLDLRKYLPGNRWLVRLLMICQVGLIPIGITYGLLAHHWDSALADILLWGMAAVLVGVVIVGGLFAWRQGRPKPQPMPVVQESK